MKRELRGKKEGETHLLVILLALLRSLARMILWGKKKIFFVTLFLTRLRGPTATFTQKNDVCMKGNIAAEIFFLPLFSGFALGGLPPVLP